LPLAAFNFVLFPCPSVFFGQRKVKTVRRAGDKYIDILKLISYISLKFKEFRIKAKSYLAL